MNILTINAGSSSIKYKVFSRDDQSMNLLLSGLIEGIGESRGRFPNHQEAFDAMALQLQKDLKGHSVDGVGHRVVHGGDKYHEPTMITPEVLTDILALAQLAPLHNPVNVAGIKYAQQHFKEAPQVAVFDTGFHHTLPSFVRQYAIDTELAERYQIRRYGFHGINHEYVATQAAKFLKKPLSVCNFINLHLGNGASACLVRDGKSFDTSMGMTPLAGLMMGTRCGDIDPGIILYLLNQGMSSSEIDELLNRKSGLKGIAQDNDMRKIMALYDNKDAHALLAIDMYVYTLQKTIGAYLSQINTLDALIFTGGIGENAAFIREKTLKFLDHFGFHVDDALNHQKNGLPCRAISTTGIPVLVICGDEERLIAEKVAGLIAGS